MNATSNLRGVFCAAATPVTDNRAPDLDLFKAHCRRLIADGCHGIALLGSTGEANSFSRDERQAILTAAIEAGIDPDQLLPGTGVPAIPDTVALTRDALALGVTRVIMLPPFYYKNVSDDGLFAAYSEVVERIGDPRLRVLLYNIPQMSGVPISIDLMTRLVSAYPDTFVGVKDSAGDLANMQATIAALPGFSVFAGADPLMLPLLKDGGAGCITATSNLVARSLRYVFDHVGGPGRADEVTAAQDRIVAYRTLSNSFPQIPTIKAMVALLTGEHAWRRVRPPLMALDEFQFAQLNADFAELD